VSRISSTASSGYDGGYGGRGDEVKDMWLEKLQAMDPERVTDWDEVG
jgi:hypothetical protein